MADESCRAMHLLIQADVDGELTSAEAARAADHVASCPACASLQMSLLQLSSRLKQEMPRHAMPATLRAALDAQRTPARAGFSWHDRLGTLARPAISFGGGFALAAGLAFFLLMPGGAMPDSIVAAHIRALQPGHLTDVVSTDQHVVKPWFDGRLPFAPPVKDLAATGFPLTGGRLDHLPGHTVATLVYGRRQHVIDLFVWPSPDEADQRPSEGMRDGYNYLRWHQDGMSFWAVSDIDAADLATFARDWRAK